MIKKLGCLIGILFALKSVSAQSLNETNLSSNLNSVTSEAIGATVNDQRTEETSNEVNGAIKLINYKFKGRNLFGRPRSLYRRNNNFTCCDLDATTAAGNVTTNSISVGGLFVQMQSGSGGTTPGVHFLSPWNESVFEVWARGRAVFTNYSNQDAFTITNQGNQGVTVLSIEANSGHTGWLQRWSIPGTGIESAINKDGWLGVGTISPTRQIEIRQKAGMSKGLLLSGDEYYVSGNGDNNGILFLNGVNRPGNRQLWIGDNTALGSSTLGFFRYITGTQLPGISAVTGDGLTRLPVNIGTPTSNVALGFDYSGVTGTDLPASLLSVNGNAAVGANFRSLAAPSNGLIVQGLTGLGLTNPTAQLSVASNTAAAIFTNHDWNDGYSGGTMVTIQNASSNTTNTYLKFISDYDGDNGGAKTFGSISFGTNNSFSLSNPLGNPLVLQATTGNVGIGTSTPPEKLSVEGTIAARKVKVTQALWPDYVFDKKYKLLSLEEVERYIQKNSHLPAVPSASEVQKEGIDVGDNQAMLLRKIEELTLYLIEQNKKIVELEKNLKKLQSIQTSNRSN